MSTEYNKKEQERTYLQNIYMQIRIQFTQSFKFLFHFMVGKAFLSIHICALKIPCYIIHPETW